VLLASTPAVSDGGLPWRQREAAAARSCEVAASADGSGEGITAAVAVRHGLYIRVFSEAGGLLEAQLYQRMSPAEKEFRASLVLVAPRHADEDSRGSILQPFGSNYALEEQFERPKTLASNPAASSMYGYKVWSPSEETEIASDPVLPRSDVVLAKAHLLAEARGWHYWVVADIDHTTRRCQLQYQGWSSKPSLRPECSVQVLFSPGPEVSGWGFWELIALPFFAAPLHHWEGIHAAINILPALLAALAMVASMCYIARRWNRTAEVSFDYILVADGLFALIAALYCGSAVHRTVILLVFASRSLFGVPEVMFILAIIMVTLAFAGVAVRTWWYIRRDVSHSKERRVSLGVASLLALFCFGAGVLVAPVLGMVAAALPERVMYRPCLPSDLTTLIRKSCQVCWNKCNSLGNIADEMTFQDAPSTGNELETRRARPEKSDAAAIPHPSVQQAVPVLDLPPMVPPLVPPPLKLDDIRPPHSSLVKSDSPPSTAPSDRKQLSSACGRPNATEDPLHRLVTHVCDTGDTHDSWLGTPSIGSPTSGVNEKMPICNVRHAALSSVADSTDWMRCPPPPPKTPAPRNRPVPPIQKTPATPSRPLTPPQSPSARNRFTADPLKDAYGIGDCFSLPPLPRLGLEVARIPALPQLQVPSTTAAAIAASPAPAGVHSMSSSGSRSGTSSSGKNRPLKRHTMHQQDREHKRAPPPILVSETTENSSAGAEYGSPMVSEESPLFSASIAENSEPRISAGWLAPTTPPRVQHPGDAVGGSEVPPPPPPRPPTGPPRAPDEPPLPVGSLGAGQSQASPQLAGDSAFAQAQLAARRLSAVSPRRLGSTGFLRQANGGLPSHAASAVSPDLDVTLRPPVSGLSSPGSADTSEQLALPVLRHAEQHPPPGQPALPVIRHVEQHPQTQSTPHRNTTSNAGEAHLTTSPTDSLSQMLWNDETSHRQWSAHSTGPD